MFNSFCCFGLISKGLLKKNANDAKKYCKNACNMENKMYICIGKLVGIEPTDTYFKRDKALFLLSKSISSQFAKTLRSNALFI